MFFHSLGPTSGHHNRPTVLTISRKNRFIPPSYFLSSGFTTFSTFLYISKSLFLLTSPFLPLLPSSSLSSHSFLPLFFPLFSLHLRSLPFARHLHPRKPHSHHSTLTSPHDRRPASSPHSAQCPSHSTHSLTHLHTRIALAHASSFHEQPEEPEQLDSQNRPITRIGTKRYRTTTRSEPDPRNQIYGNKPLVPQTTPNQTVTTSYQHSTPPTVYSP